MPREAKLNRVKDKVYDLILTENDLISSDKRLIIEYYKKYHNIVIPSAILDKDVPAFESVTRARRKAVEELDIPVGGQVELERYYQEVSHNTVFRG